jgi:hypothetical protein
MLYFIKKKFVGTCRFNRRERWMIGPRAAITAPLATTALPPALRRGQVYLGGPFDPGRRIENLPELRKIGFAGDGNLVQQPEGPRALGEKPGAIGEQDVTDQAVPVPVFGSGELIEVGGGEWTILILHGGLPLLRAA